MAQYNDPTVCHPGECADCGREVRDRDNLDDNERCSECAADRAAEAEELEDDDA